jgi:NNP family nitrate/nitrite transporter-like MFS transporter
MESPRPGKKWIVPFVATLFGMMALQISSLGFAPLLPQIQKAFGMSYSQIGLFTGTYGLLAIVLSVPAGVAAKYFGEKRVLIAGLVVVALGLGALSVAGSFTGAILGRGLWIAGYRFAFVCVLTAIGLTCPPSLRGRTMGVLGAMSSLASVVGAPFGSSIGEAFGWREGIRAFGCAALLGAAVVAIFYRDPSAESEAAQADSIIETRSSVAGAANAFRTPVVWALALLFGLVGMPSFSVTFFLPSAAASIFKLDALSASWIISSGYLAAIFLNLVVGYLMDRYNKWIVMGTLMTLLVPSCLAMTTSDLLLFRIGAASILGIGFTATNQIYGISADVLHGRQTGNVMGIVSLGAGVCGYLGPQMLGALRDWTGGFAAGWYMMAAIAAISVAEFAIIGKHSHSQKRSRKLTPVEPTS